MQAYSYHDSGIEWQGLVPSHWKKNKLFRLCEKMGSGGTPSSGNESYYGGDIPWIQSGDLNDSIVSETEKSITEEAVASSSAKIFKKGTLLVAMYGATIGKLGIMAMDAATNQACCALQFTKKLRTDYSYYLLLDMRAFLITKAYGGGQANISQEILKQRYFCYPSLAEQRAIATYLDEACGKIDAAIQVKREQISQNEVILASVIQHAVTKGLNLDAPLRDSGISWIGKVPTHWQVKKLKRILAEVDYGISESTKQEGKHPVLKMGNVVNGEIVSSKIEYVDSVPASLILRKDDLLFNRTNSHDQVAKVAIFRDSEADQVTFASYLVRLRPNHSSSPYYLNYFLNTDAFLCIARKMAIPSVQQANLNPTRYGRLEVAVPPLAEQTEIAAYLDKKVHDIRQVADTLQQQIAVLEAYKKSLIHECVTGKKQVWQGD